jgi:phenylacetate-CoA ligase
MDLGILRHFIYLARKEYVSFALKEIESINSYSHIDTNDYIHKKLKQQLHYITNNIFYYKSISSFKASDLSIDLFSYVDKKEIKNNYIKFLNNKEKVYARSTSGTTGEPFVFVKDVHASSYMDAMMYHVYGWHGILPTDKQARLWGRAIDVKGQLIQGAKDYLLNRRRFSAFEMDEEKSRKYYELLLNFKPKYFYCYPSTLYKFALFLEKLQLDGRKLKVPIAICTGEILFAHYREKIEHFFGCKVISEYGSTENGIIGIECDYGNMHVLPTIYLEIKDQDVQGYGNIAVTELNSKSIPFVKYLIGDIGKFVKDSCPCGRCYPILEIREGRIDDYIKCPNGSIVYDAILAYTFKGYFEQFKAYQKTPSLLSINYLNVEELSLYKEQFLRNKLQAYLGNDMNIHFERVEKIAPDRSGKMRYFVPLE